MNSSELEIYYRFDPGANFGQLDKIDPNFVLWLHGGKFGPALAKLAEYASHIGIRNIALDLGQKNRLVGLSTSDQFDEHQSGREVIVGQRIVLTTRPISDFSLGDTIVAQANWLPNIASLQGRETGIVFGDGKHSTTTDILWPESNPHSLALAVRSTENGQIFDNQAFVGEKLFFPEERPTLLVSKDHGLLEAISPNLVNRLIFSFVRNEVDVTEAYQAIDNLWPGWRKNPSNKIVWKIETAQALRNLQYFLTLENCHFMLGLGDLEVACASARPEPLNFDDEIERTLNVFDSAGASVIVASGLANSALDEIKEGKIIDLSAGDRARIKRFSTHPSVAGLGLTYEGVRASQKNLLPQLLESLLTRRFGESI